MILFGDALKGTAIKELVDLGDSLEIPVRYVCLLDYANSRGAADMGLLPDLLPGYRPLSEAGLEPGLSLPAVLDAEDLDVLWVVGANPLSRRRLAAKQTFIVVQDLFLTETAKAANVILPAASAYEKTGTVTTVCGEVQRVTRALQTVGTKSDLEIFGLIQKQMGLSLNIGTPEAVLEEIRRTVPGYAVPPSLLNMGEAMQCRPPDGLISAISRPDLIQSACDTLFTSGTLGRYSAVLNSVLEGPGALYH